MMRSVSHSALVSEIASVPPPEQAASASHEPPRQRLNIWYQIRTQCHTAAQLFAQLAAVYHIAWLQALHAPTNSTNCSDEQSQAGIHLEAAI